MGGRSDQTAGAGRVSTGRDATGDLVHDLTKFLTSKYAAVSMTAIPAGEMMSACASRNPISSSRDPPPGPLTPGRGAALGQTKGAQKHAYLRICTMNRAQTRQQASCPAVTAMSVRKADRVSNASEHEAAWLERIRWTGAGAAPPTAAIVRLGGAGVNGPVLMPSLPDCVGVRAAPVCSRFRRRSARGVGKNSRVAVL